jgi:hypothetical protein
VPEALFLCCLICQLSADCFFPLNIFFGNHRSLSAARLLFQLVEVSADISRFRSLAVAPGSSAHLSTTAGGRSSLPVSPPWLWINIDSIAFFNSRILPGQSLRHHLLPRFFRQPRHSPPEPCVVLLQIKAHARCGILVPLAQRRRCTRATFSRNSDPCGTSLPAQGSPDPDSWPR